MEENKKIKIGLSVIISITVVLIIVAGVLIYIFLNKETNKEEQNNNNNDNMNFVVDNNVAQEKENNISVEELDKSVDEQTETIMQEGLESKITTLKYVSSLGYSMRYESELISVSKNNNMDVYSSKNNDKFYYTVEKIPTSYEYITTNLDAQNISKTNINGNEVTYFDRVISSLLVNYYYIKAEDGTFLITINCPNSSEYVEGWLDRIDNMIKTFDINER